MAQPVYAGYRVSSGDRLKETSVEGRKLETGRPEAISYHSQEQPKEVATEVTPGCRVLVCVPRATRGQLISRRAVGQLGLKDKGRRGQGMEPMAGSLMAPKKTHKAGELQGDINRAVRR